MATQQVHLQVSTLTEGLQRELRSAHEWLLDPKKARFVQYANGIEICHNIGDLSEIIPGFFKAYPRPITETRFTALRCTSNATIPVAGRKGDLIPISVTGSPTISDIPLQVGHVVHLTQDASATPTFYCFLILTSSTTS